MLRLHKHSSFISKYLATVTNPLSLNSSGPLHFPTLSSCFSNSPILLRRRHNDNEFKSDPDAPPRLFVVQPRFRPQTLLKAKLDEALNLVNSLDQQRDGFYQTEFLDKEMPPHLVVQNPSAKSPRVDTFFGAGTVGTVKIHINDLNSKEGVDAIFVNAILSGIQQRNLEQAWGRPVLDRVGLIIEIFNAHAQTKEAKLQAELAALMYKRSRLVRVRGLDGRYTFGGVGEAEVVSARGRGSGGRGFISGAGETELQLQRRRYGQFPGMACFFLICGAFGEKLLLLGNSANLSSIRLLDIIHFHTMILVISLCISYHLVHIHLLSESWIGEIRCCLKSKESEKHEPYSVLLVKSKVAHKDKKLLLSLWLVIQMLLFATVDPKLSSVILPSGRKILLSDTVGFISDLPVELVEAFHATLEEVIEADLLVHVLDSSASNLDEHRETVFEVLGQIGVSEEKLHNMIEVWNKVDLQPEFGEAELDDEDYISDSPSEDGNDVESDQLPVQNDNDQETEAELSPLEEDIDGRQADYSDGWLSTRDKQESWIDYDCSERCKTMDDQQREFSCDWRTVATGSRSQAESTHHVKTSAITGVGLQELLELIDEKLLPIQVVERSILDRKWRPPQREDNTIAV